MKRISITLPEKAVRQTVPSINTARALVSDTPVPRIFNAHATSIARTVCYQRSQAESRRRQGSKLPERPKHQ
jgi:hypothetical protein